MENALSGAFPVLPTIFHEGGSIDDSGFRSTIEFALDNGADGVVFPGLASEYDHLTLDERLALITIVGRATRGRAHFIVGASADDPAETVTLAKAGAAVGAAAAMVLTPKAFDGHLDEVSRFFRDLGTGTPLPIMLQNAPRPMGLGLKPSDVANLVSEAPGVVYLKEETMPCGQQISALLKSVPSQIRGVFGGAGGRYILNELARGAVGTMPAVELVDLHVALIAAHRAGDQDRAMMLYERMLPILNIQAVYRWSLTKTVLKLRGIIDCAYVRAPGPRLDDQDIDELRTMLDRIADLLHPPLARLRELETTA